MMTFMQNSLFAIFVLLLSLNMLFAEENSSSKKTPTTVPSVDLTRYTGLWYEIAKIPNRFQKKCAGNTTAEYALRDDGQIDVINTCYNEKGEKEQVKGIAQVVDETSRAKLRVSFVRLLGFQLFWGDYWIIGLEENYQYAIVGTPNRKYGWILARKPQLSELEMEEARKILREQGYNPDDFAMTQHTNAD